MSVPDRDDLVAALRAVPGVADADLVAGDLPVTSLDAGTLRLSLAPGADEVMVATRVNQLLRQDFGLGVDAGRVELLEESVPQRRLNAVPTAGAGAPAQESSTTAQLPVLAQGGRLLIQRMQLVSATPGVAVAVTLAVDGQCVVGEAGGAASPGSVHRSVAEATLRAVESITDGRALLHLERVEVAPLGEDQVVLVAVSMTSVLGTERLVGTSAVREDVRQAVIRATLDALNRRLEVVLAAADDTPA